MSAQRHSTAAAWSLALTAALLAPAARADDVLLHNGNAFEGVIVVAESDEQVRIRLPYGELSLPRSWIARIDRSPSPLEEYLKRRGELRARVRVGMEDWLDLARWARGRELAHGYKEALLEASHIEPRHPDLGPLLRGIEYAFEESSGRWVAVADLRRAAAAEEAAARADVERQRRAEALRNGDRRPPEETLSRAIEALALAELERETRTSAREARGERTYYPYRVGAYAGPFFPYYPGLVATAAPAGGDDGETAAEPASLPPDPYAVVRNRIPGSLLVTRPTAGGRVGSQSRPHLPGSLLQSRPR